MLTKPSAQMLPGTARNPLGRDSVRFPRSTSGTTSAPFRKNQPPDSIDCALKFRGAHGALFFGVFLCRVSHDMTPAMPHTFCPYISVLSFSDRFYKT
jgi:hypothetical protein